MTGTRRTAAGDVQGAIHDALAAVAITLDPVPGYVVREGRPTWMVAGHAIVTLAGSAASFRVGAEIGAAARRTADAGDSSLGPDWVEFSPPILDGHAQDRLAAWFAAAHRRARPVSG